MPEVCRTEAPPVTQSTSVPSGWVRNAPAMGRGATAGGRVAASGETAQHALVWRTGWQ